MNLQIEITTRCNFDCFYCAGRDMSQVDMTYELFEQLLREHIAVHGVPAHVSLQGEGEPTLHRDFFRMAKRVRDIGSRPYTITNGTCKRPQRFIGLFPSIGVSVDTVNAKEGESIGRYNLPRVLSFIEALRHDVRIVVHTVALSESVRDVAHWCQERHLEHIIQPLQTKADYSYRYPDWVDAEKSVDRFNCRFLTQPIMRYYTVSGVELPCCFIKDVAKFPGMSAMYDHQRRGALPACCEGCQHAGVSAVPTTIAIRR